MNLLVFKHDINVLGNQDVEECLESVIGIFFTSHCENKLFTGYICLYELPIKFLTTANCLNWSFVGLQGHSESYPKLYNHTGSGVFRPSIQSYNACWWSGCCESSCYGLKTRRKGVLYRGVDCLLTFCHEYTTTVASMLKVPFYFWDLFPAFNMQMLFTYIMNFVRGIQYFTLDA